MHPDLVTLVGRMKYRTSYSQNILDHSLEVAQIARTLSTVLGANSELAEAIALAHDLGHPPFGHTGEEQLQSLLLDDGGFDHNLQSLKIVTKLEEMYASHPGLNLTIETLDGIIKHNGPLTKKNDQIFKYIKDLKNFELTKSPSIEAQIAAISDDVAYNNHDVEDAIRAGLLSIDQLQENIFFSNIINQLKKEYTIIDDKLLMFQVLRKSMSLMIEDIYNQTKKNIIDFEIKTKENLQNYNNFIVTFSPSMQSKAKGIKSFLFDNVYNHQNLLDKRQNVEKIISDLL